MRTIVQVIKKLKINPIIAYNIWTTEDILLYYNNFYDNSPSRFTLTTQDTEEILKNIHNNFDAELNLT